jgi:hypothetical protein
LIKAIGENEDFDKFTYKYDPRIEFFQKNNYELRIHFYTEPGIYHHKYSLSTKIQSGSRPVPGLYWEFYSNYSHDQLRILAYKDRNSDERYKAPFLNTSNNVCLGSSEFDTDLYRTKDVTFIADDIIKSFFDSAFTHAGGSRQVKGNIITLSNKLLNLKVFPEDQLVSTTELTQNDEYEDDE